MKRILLLWLAMCPAFFAAEPDPHRAAATRLFDVIHAGIDPGALMYAGMKPSFQKLRDRGMPEAGIAELEAIGKKYCDRILTDGIYRRKWEDYFVARFSAGELNQVAEFLSSSAGKKLQALLPETERMSSEFARAAFTAIQPDLMKEVQEVQKKYVGEKRD